MNRILTAMAIVFGLGLPLQAEEYLLFRNADLKPPRVGDGFDPIRRPADRVRMPAVARTVDIRRTSAVQASVSIHELNDTCSNATTREGSAQTALQQVVQAELRMQDYSSIFEQHSVFVVQAMLVNRIETAADLCLRHEASTLSEADFRQKHGVRMVERIDYGGHIFLVYVFRTRKDEVRRKIISSLQACYSDVSEKASFTNYLEKSGVATEFTVHTLQDGGDMAPFMNPNIAEFRTYLERWVPSVGRHPAPVRFYTARYHDVLTDFPHRWMLGFGKVYSGESNHAPHGQN